MARVVKSRVRESFTTTGAGDIAGLGATGEGMRSFGSVMSTGDTAPYCARKLNQWEKGELTFTSPNTLARTRVLENSDGNTSKISFGDGTGEIFIDWPAAGLRRVLFANLTLYVRDDGNDSNLGEANTANGAFLTPQKAADKVIKEIDTNGFTVTIKLTGTFTSQMKFDGPVVGGGTVIVTADATASITTTNADAIAACGGANITVSGAGNLTLSTVTAGCGLIAYAGSHIRSSGLIFGAVASAQIQAGGTLDTTTLETLSERAGGGVVEITGNTSVSAGGGSWLHCVGPSLIHIHSTATITWSGTCAYGNYVVGITKGIIWMPNVTLTGGTVAGAYYVIHRGGDLITTNGVAGDLRGDTAGTLASGGRIMSLDDSVADVGVKRFVTSTGILSLPAGTDTLLGLATATLAGHIYGLTLSNNVSDATNDIDIAAGEAASTATAPIRMVLASAITKRLDASWTVGTNQGGLDTGSIADTTYHVWLIQRSDTAVVDVLFSTSASSPTMPTNYDRKRRIGSIVRTGAAIKAFIQDGDIFRWASPVVDVTAGNPGTSAVTRTLTLPTGIRVQANLAVGGSDTSSTGLGAIYISDLSLTDNAAAFGTGNFSCGNNLPFSAATHVVGWQVEVMTNTSAQVRSRVQTSGANTTLNITTRGWADRRGRDS